MKRNQVAMAVLAVGVIAGVVIFLRQAQKEATPPQRVTKTAKGEGQIVTSPINETRAAVLTNPLRVAFELFAKSATTVKQYVVGSLATISSGDKLSRQANALSATAADAAPLRTDYAAKIFPDLKSNAPAEASRAGNSFQFN